MPNISKEEIERAAGHPDAVPHQYIKQFISGANWMQEIYANQYRTAGLRWVKCQERMPKETLYNERKTMFVRLPDNFIVRRIDNKNVSIDFFLLYGIKWGIENYEWLDESETVNPSTSEWISVEQKPNLNRDGEVYVVMNIIVWDKVEGCSYQKGYSELSGFDDPDITHWMYLPSAPPTK